MDDLEGFTVPAVKGRPQCLVPLNDLIQASFQSADIESTSQPKRSGHVVKSSCRFKLVKEPQPLLGVGSRKSRYIFNGFCWFHPGQSPALVQSCVLAPTRTQHR